MQADPTVGQRPGENVSRNPVYLTAEKSGCHTSCVIPAAVLKAVEVAMGMALPREVRITFEPCPEKPADD